MVASKGQAANRILILFAHPALEKSRVNIALADAVRGVEGIELHDLYQVYPDFFIDVEREQALLREQDIIVFQLPFYWYSTPALLKEWQDLVLEHGFAYGAGATALRGKSAMSAISTGGSREAYRPEGINRHTIGELLAPIAQTANLCGMAYLPPFVVHGTHRLTEPGQIAPYATAYRKLLEALRDDRIEAEMLAGAIYLNDLLEALDAGGG